jgi:hypothetical protein
MKVKPHLVISHLLPGCFFLLLWLLAYNHWNFAAIKDSIKGLETTSLIGLGIVLLIAAVRDGALESIIDLIPGQKITWDFFFRQDDPEKVERLEDYYYTWYVFNINSALALIFGGVASRFYFKWTEINRCVFAIWLMSIGFLLLDGFVLRRDLVKHSH